MSGHRFSFLKINKYLMKTNPLILALVFSFILTAEYFALGKYSYVEMFDIGDSFLPKNIITIRNLFDNGFQYWYPNKIGGLDLLGQGYFYSHLNFGTLIYVLFPGWLASGIYMFLVYFIGIYSMGRLLREQVQINTLWSILLSIAYCLLIDRDYTSLAKAYLPLMIIMISLSIEKNSIFITILLSIIFVSVTSPLFDIINLVIIAYWLLIYKRNNVKHVRNHFSVLIVVAIIYYSINIIPLLLNIDLSHRSVIVNSFLNWSEILTHFFALHDYYYRAELLLVLFIYALTICYFSLKNKHMTYLLIFFISIISFVILISFIVNYDLGLFNFLKGYNFAYFFSANYFIMIVFGAFTIKFVGSNLHNWQLLLLCLIILTICFKKYDHFKSYIIGVNGSVSKGSDYKSTFENEMLINLREKDQEIYRVMPVTLPPSSFEAYGFEMVGGYSSLGNKYFQKYFSLLDKNFLVVGNRLYFYQNKRFSIQKSYNADLISLLNTRYIFSKYRIMDMEKHLIHDLNFDDESRIREKFKTTLLNRFNGVVNFYIYELPNYLNRFYFVNSLQSFKEEDDLIETMKLSNYNKLKSTAFIIGDMDDIKTYNKNCLTSKIKVDEYSADQIILKFDNKSDCLLIVSNSYSPYWEAKTNIESKKIMRVNLTFWGIHLNENDKQIRFTYAPPYKL